MRKFVTLLCLLTITASNAAEIPALPEISPAVAGARPDLVQRRAELLSERSTLKAQSESHNSDCRNVEEGSEKDAPCTAALAALSEELRRHIAASNKFIATLSEVRVFDSRTLITAEAYDRAIKDLAGLREQEQRLQNKLVELRGWRNDLNRHAREFEQMRDEARRDVTYELLDHVPVSEGLSLLVHKQYLDPVLKGRIDMGYQAMKSFLTHAHDVSGKDTTEQANKIIDGNRAIRKAMTAMVEHKLDKNTMLWLEGLTKAFDAMAKGVAGAASDKQSKEHMYKTVLSVLEALYPPGGLLIIGERLGERWRMNRTANQVLSSLGQALGNNWNAELYLRQKLEDVQAKIPEVERLVKGYQKVHGKSR